MGLRENGNKIGRYAAGSMEQLSDTNITNKAEGDVIQYDNTSGKWKNKPTTFSEASSRTNIASGDSLSTIFGKISKFFTDLKTVAFSGSYSDLSNKPNIASLYGLWAGSGNQINSLDDLVNLLNNSGGASGGRGFAVTCKINTDIGIGATGWQRIIAYAQNGANNGTYDLGMCCLLLPSASSEIMRYCIIQGKTTGNYSVQASGAIQTAGGMSTYKTITSSYGLDIQDTEYSDDLPISAGSGWKPVAISGVSSGKDSVCIYNSSISSNTTFSIGLRKVGSGNIGSTTVTVKILCVRENY